MMHGKFVTSDGKAIEDAQIWFMNNHTILLPRRIATTRTKDDGTFSCEVPIRADFITAMQMQLSDLANEPSSGAPLYYAHGYLVGHPIHFKEVDIDTNSTANIIIISEKPGTTSR